MELIIKTEKGRTDITDGRGNTFITLYGVKSIVHDGKILVECTLTGMKTIKEEVVNSSTSGTITMPQKASKRKKGKQ